MFSRPLSTYIDNLNDDSLLTIFYLCRPILFDEDEHGRIDWEDWGPRQCWWYKFVQVCRRWRYLILASAGHLGICFLCTPGTPIADILAHSVPLPLMIDYDGLNCDLATEDEEGIMLALQHRDRLRCIRLEMPVLTLEKFLAAMDGEFPILEFLQIEPPMDPDSGLILPSTFQAPQLRHLILDCITSPIGSPLLASATALVTLVLQLVHPYPHANHVLQILSRLSQLETLLIEFPPPVLNHDFERELLHMPIITQVTLPSLHWFSFWGISAYLEALLPYMTTPLLQTFIIHFFNQPSFSVSRLLQFLTTTKNLRFSSTKFLFHDEEVAAFVYSHVGDRVSKFNVEVICEHLDSQVSSMAQIFNVLSPLFSTVMDLTLDYKVQNSLSEWRNEADRTKWRQLLRSFRNVKTLRVHHGLVGELSRSLRSDGEPPLEILPELKGLICPAGSLDDGAFTTFIHERGVAGHYVNLIGEAFPVGRTSYKLFSPTRVYYIDPDPVPLR